jgi:hypothetical protein
MPVETPGFVLHEFRQTMTSNSQESFGTEMTWGGNVQRRFEDSSKRFTQADLDEMVRKGYLKKGDLWYLRFQCSMIGLPWPIEGSPSPPPETSPASNKVTRGPVSAKQILDQVRAVFDEIDEGNLENLYGMTRAQLEKVIGQSTLYSLYIAGLLTDADTDTTKEETRHTLTQVIETVFTVILSNATGPQERLDEMK